MNTLRCRSLFRIGVGLELLLAGLVAASAADPDLSTATLDQAFPAGSIHTDGQAQLALDRVQQVNGAVRHQLQERARACEQAFLASRCSDAVEADRRVLDQVSHRITLEAHDFRRTKIIRKPMVDARDVAAPVAKPAPVPSSTQAAADQAADHARQQSADRQAAQAERDRQAARRDANVPAAERAFRLKQEQAAANAADKAAEKEINTRKRDERQKKREAQSQVDRHQGHPLPTEAGANPASVDR
jgi:hypothetical protein